MVSRNHELRQIWEASSSLIQRSKIPFCQCEGQSARPITMATNKSQGSGVVLNIVILVLAFHVTGCCSSLFPEIRGHDYRRVEQEVGTEEKEVHCSRSRSRTAREIIDEYLVPFLEQEEYNLSTKCRLHPANDMFQDQEGQKDPLRPTQWQCGYCKKLFRSEEFLDKHFDNRHYDKLDLDPNRCVADICGALHCDYVSSQTKISQKKVCNQAAVTRNKHLCESLANSCFPPQESMAAMRLHEFFLRQFCDTHTCKKGQMHFPRGSGKRKNKALFFAFSLFTIILLFIFYVAVYLHRREMSLNTTNLKRLAKDGIMKTRAQKKS